jgi:phage shock protein A
MIDLNSVEAVKQHVRDLETSKDNLSDTLAEARGQKVTVSRELGQFKTRQSRLDNQVNTLLTDSDTSNDHLAKTLEAELLGVENLISVKEDEFSSVEKTVQALDEALSALKAKHTAMVQELSRLETLDKASKAKEGAAQAMRHAAKLSSTGSEVSVDSVAAKIQRRADVADQRLQAAMDTFSSSTERDSTLAAVEARLVERKKRLAETTVTT